MKKYIVVGLFLIASVVSAAPHRHRVHIVVPAIQADAAGAALVNALGDKASPNDAQTFINSAEMGPAGAENSTHRSASMVLTDDQLAAVQTELGNVPGVHISVDDETITGAARRAEIAAENGTGLKRDWFDLRSVSGLEFWISAKRSPMWQDLARTVPATGGDHVAVWEDISGNGNHFSQPVTEFQPGLKLIDGTLVPDFDKDFMTLAQAAGGAPPFTIALRVMLRITPSLNGINAWFLAKKSTTASSDYVWVAYARAPSDQLRFQYKTAADQIITTYGDQLVTGVWAVVIVTVGTDFENRLLLGNVLQDTATSPDFLASDDVLIIGARDDPNGLMDGFISVAAFWNRKLTEAEEAAVYEYLLLRSFGK